MSNRAFVFVVFRTILVAFSIVEAGTYQLKQEQRVLEGVPIQVNGHNHRIECLLTDGNMIASSCLQGQVKIWDVTNGELMAEIHRNNHFDMQRKEGQRSPTAPVLIKGEPSGGNITGMQEIYPE